MKFVTLRIAVVVAAVGAVGLAAQGKPSFSGAWIGVGPEPPIRELTITHDDSTLTLEGVPNVARHTFKIAAETPMTAPDGKPLVGRTAWQGNTLVLTVHFPEIKQDIRRVTWALDAAGQLVMETEMLGGKPEPTTRQVFKRK